MSNVKADASGVIEACPACGKKNRIPYEKLDATANCGSCHADIPVLSTPVDVESEAAFERLMTSSAIPVVVDYWAPWCGPCRMVAPELEKVAKNNAGRFVVAKVDTQSLPSLGARAQVQSIPAMVIFDKGKEVTRTVGARPAPAIEAFVWDAIGK